MNRNQQRAARAALAPGALCALALALASCADGTATGTHEADAIAPRVSIGNGGDGGEIVVKASDNLSLRRLVVAIDGLAAHDTTFTQTTASYEHRITLAAGQSANVEVLARDGAGNTAQQTARVGGSAPALTIVSPQQNEERAPGNKVAIVLRATDDDGVARLGYTVWRGTTAVAGDTALFASPIRDTTISREYTVPAGEPDGTVLSVRAFAVDAAGDSTGGAAVAVKVVSAATESAPLVRQMLAPRVESGDALVLSASSASGIQRIGFTMTCARTGATVTRDSTMPSGWTPQPVAMPLNIPTSCVGGAIHVTSHAASNSGKTGYSVAATATKSQSDPALAWRDSALAVFGATTPLRSGARNAIGVDIAVDSAYDRVFVSNILNDRVEVWENGAFSRDIPVGSQPWGVFLASGRLYVANSGGTNISEIPTTVPTGSLRETTRHRTQNILAWDVTEARDAATGTIRFSVSPAYDFSDRPQFLAVGATGTLYFSTKPTPSAPDGTIRLFDPSRAVPEPSQVGDYMGYKEAHIVVLNADAVAVIKAPANTGSDTLILCDHPYGTAGARQCAKGVSAAATLTALRSAVGTTDVRLHFNADIETLGLSDTTFVAAGGDRRWIGFGEGNTPGAGRVMMIEDATQFFSGGDQVVDLIGNASETVTGLAINADSRLTSARGREAYFFSVDNPFHLRLEGKVATHPKGAGIAFHPLNAGLGSTTPPDRRLAFVASADGTIEVVDSYHWGTRGTLPVRSKLHGPIRAVLPFGTEASDPANPVVLKLFGLTSEGMVAIDVRKCDLLEPNGSEPAGCP